FYTRSSDGGAHWSEPVQLDPDIPADFTPQIFQFEIDARDGLHAAWNDYTVSGGSEAVSRWLRYSHSFDGGSTWSAPAKLDEFDPSGDPLTQSTRSPHGIAFTGDQVHIVWTGGPPGAPTGVGRKYRTSPDRGVTWGDIATNIFGAWGEQNGDGLATDSSGVVHWVGLVRKFVGPGQLWEGLWGADWNGAWSEPTQVVTRLSPGIDSPRLASTPGGQRVAAFRSSPDSETGLRYLFATHDSGPAFYFPHYGDGQGLSMQVAINNPSDQTASGRLAVYDQAGDPQELPFADLGSMSSVDLSIPPKSTRVLTTLGTSDPVRVGFIRVELDQPEASGVAIFRYASGPEASVLPSSPGRRFALFVERSDRLRTGIALARLSPNQPVSLALYSLDGTLVESRDYPMAATQEAKFVDELLDVPSEFQGLLVIESPALLTAVGLRFGNGVLSTIPIVDLDSQESARSAFLFPHYGDGSGLSMQFAVNNLNASSAATGLLSILAVDGSPQELPLADGSHSEVSLHLAPHATEVLESRGTSIPPRTGFVSVESDQPGISGVAIFKYASGPEASVLPSHYGKRFVLFAERSASLRTGIALVRAGSDTVTLSLYNDQGTLVGSRPFEFSPGGRQGARFLSEAFTDLPQDFSGLLILESDADFAAIGLRFGGGVLSTIPVTPLE
ncbi:MAG: sialidase family protein, partial [Acidobacteriota bacterium]